MPKFKHNQQRIKYDGTMSAPLNYDGTISAPLNNDGLSLGPRLPSGCRLCLDRQLTLTLIQILQIFASSKKMHCAMTS